METKDPKCPKCGTVLDTTIPADFDFSTKPVSGDIAICTGCAAILLFAEDLSLEKCPPTILDELDKETRLQINRARVAILMTKEKKK
jgi:phage FluMu protein Com